MGSEGLVKAVFGEGARKDSAAERGGAGPARASPTQRPYLVVLKGFRSGASSWEIAPMRPRSNQFMAGTRCRIHTAIGSGFPPKAAFGSKAVRPKDNLRQPHEIASPIVVCSRRR